MSCVLSGTAALAPCQAPGHELRLLGPLGLAGRAGADPSAPEGHVLLAQDVHVHLQGQRQPLQPPQVLREAAGLASPDKPHLGIEGPELPSASVTPCRRFVTGRLCASVSLFVRLTELMQGNRPSKCLKGCSLNDSYSEPLMEL